MPLALVIAVVAVGLLVLGLLTARLLGFEPLRRFGPLRASASEAGDRTLDTAADFWDWVKRGH